MMSSTQGLHGGSMNPCSLRDQEWPAQLAPELPWRANGDRTGSSCRPLHLPRLPARRCSPSNPIPAFSTPVAATTPLGTLGDPRNDIGRTIVAMCGDDWNYVTGLTLMLDGGNYLAQ